MTTTTPKPETTAAEPPVPAARRGDPRRSKQSELEAFEDFYKDVRGRLLLQTWALTGDLPAAQKAVRDALVIAWHHWRKVRRLSCLPTAAGSGEREDWVRPIAWSHATRRHQVPHLPRNRNVDPEVRRTLDALAALSPTRRKVLLLSHLTTIPLEAVAREVAIPLARAEQELVAAMAAVSAELGLASADEILARFAPMAAEVEHVRWPRPTILARQGTTRRRLHALVGVGIAAAAFIGSGFAVAGGDDSSTPSLGELTWVDTDGGTNATPYELPTTVLLTPEQVDAAMPLPPQKGTATPTSGTVPAGWTVELTGDNSAADASGDDAELPCQRDRLADPRARGALVRTFASGNAVQDVGQLVEMSSSATSAASAYQTAVGWYAGCNDSRTQLVGTYSLGGVGDEATVVSLRDWAHHGRDIDVAVARTGVLTTTVAVTSWPAEEVSDLTPTAVSTLVADAVNGICQEPGAGACATVFHPTPTPIAPVAVGDSPAMLDEVDLPPVAGIDQPWVGTDPVDAETNLAATHCDQTSFDVPGISRARTRSFVIPTDKKLPAEFGLTETVGHFVTHDAAYAFTSQVRAKMDSCEKRELGSHVTRLQNSSTNGAGMAFWRVRIEVSRSRTVTYLMAIVRRGNAVAQLGFVPSGNATISTTDFAGLAERAQQRLAHLR